VLTPTVRAASSGEGFAGDRLDPWFSTPSASNRAAKGTARLFLLPDEARSTAVDMLEHLLSGDPQP
jgi:hypothetical protein